MNGLATAHDLDTHTDTHMDTPGDTMVWYAKNVRQSAQLLFP
jgi:hypothetical protein